MILTDKTAWPINVAHWECKEHLANSVRAAIKVGRMLIDAKAKCDHGQWLKFVRKHLAFKVRSAQEYLKIARRIEAIGDAQRVAHFAKLPLREVMRELADAQADKSELVVDIPKPASAQPPQPMVALAPRPASATPRPKRAPKYSRKTIRRLDRLQWALDELREILERDDTADLHELDALRGAFNDIQLNKVIALDEATGADPISTIRKAAAITPIKQVVAIMN